MRHKSFSLAMIVFVFLFVSFFSLISPPQGSCAVIYQENYDMIMSPDLPNREGLKVGNVILHSALRSGVDFDSNIFYADQGEQSDTIAYVAPSFGIEVPIQDSRLSVEYEASMAFFNQSNEQDHTDHKVRGLLAINLTDFKVLIDDTYNRVTNRAGSTEVGTTGIRTREERNNVDVSVGAEFDKLAYRATYTNKIRRYLGEGQPLFGTMNYDDKNSVANIADIEVDYAFFPKTTLLLEQTAGTITYDSSLVPDSYFYELLPGFKSEWTNKLKMDMRLGGRYQDYSSSDLVYDENFFGVVGRGQVDYKLTDDDTFTLTAERSVRESIYQNVNYYVANSAGIAYAHKFNDKLTSNLLFGWQMNTYPTQTTENGLTATRRDHIYRSGFSLRYEPQNWLAFEAGIEHRVRKSIKFPTLDYTDNVASFQATVGF
ncbi:MAG TPA: hypothetical protein DCL35_03105 [Candidatus Omnitrophica bacterium]|nr:hypothetical protein [Candidatus Omnitrophota bacterium]